MTSEHSPASPVSSQGGVSEVARGSRLVDNTNYPSEQSTTQSEQQKSPRSYHAPISLEERLPMTCRVIQAECLSMYRGGGVPGAPLASLSGKTSRESNEAPGHDMQTAELGIPVNGTHNVRREGVGTIRNEMGRHDVESTTTIAEHFVSEDNLRVLIGTSRTAKNNAEATGHGLNGGVQEVGATDNHLLGNYRGGALDHALPAMGAGSRLTSTEICRSEGESSSDKNIHSLPGFSCAPAREKVFRKHRHVESGTEQLPTCGGDHDHRRSLEFQPSAKGVGAVEAPRELRSHPNVHVSHSVSSDDNPLRSESKLLPKLCTPVSSGKEGRENAALPQQETIFRSTTIGNAASGSRSRSPWRQQLEAGRATKGASPPVDNSRVVQSGSALAELEMKLRARQREAESGLAVAGARAKLVEMAYDGVQGQAFSASELLRQKEAALEHLQHEVARLVLACEQMKRELDGAREQGAISPSSVEDEPGTLVGSAGTPRGGGPRARGSKGRLSSPTSEPFREGERRGREGAPSTCAHDQGSSRAHSRPLRPLTRCAEGRVGLEQVGPSGHVEASMETGISAGYSGLPFGVGMQDCGRVASELVQGSSCSTRNAEVANGETDEERPEETKMQCGRRPHVQQQQQQQQRHHYPVCFAPRNSNVPNGADSDETACASPVTTTSATSSCDENAQADTRRCDSPLVRLKKPHKEGPPSGTVVGGGILPPGHREQQAKVSPAVHGVGMANREPRRLGGHFRGMSGVKESTISSRDRPSNKERSKRGQGPSSQSSGSHKGQRRHGPEFADGITCIEVPVGREDEGLLLGGGRVLHKLKEELGGTLEYRRAEGVVLIHGQRAGPQKAAACVRTARLLTDGTREPMAEEYDMARLCMDDLVAESIALKGLPQTCNGARGKIWNEASTTHNGSNPASTSVSPTASTPHSTAGGAGSVAWSAVTTGPTKAPSPPPSSNSAPAATATAVAAASSGAGTPPPTSTATSPSTAATVVMDVGSTLPDGEYPPQAGSLRIIGETFGCVIDVVGEVAAQAAAAAVAADAETFASGRSDRRAPLRPNGSPTPVGNHDVLIWGPAGAVIEAKDAVAALVSANACAEVIVGATRIKRRDRGFWVNCETMASGMTVEVDHKRGSVWIRGRPEAVEEGRRDFHNKLASLFPGDFLAVPMPRAALKDLANARGLASAATEAKAEFSRSHVSRTDEIDEDGVELWADWRCSCVRLRGAPAVVRRAAKALYAALAEWNTLEVSVRVDRSIVTRLLSRSGRILAGISSNMGITLLVEREKGILRGRARTEEDAKEANRVLKLKVNALSMRRSEHSAPPPPPPSRASPPTVPSPPVSSTRSDLSMASVGSSNGGCSEESMEEAEKELTDPFDELQAFFAGAPRAEIRSSDGSSSGPTKRSCVFDGIDDTPTSKNIVGANGDAVNGVAPRPSPLALQRSNSSARGHGPSLPSGAGIALGAGGGIRGRGRSQPSPRAADQASGGAVLATGNGCSGSHHRACPQPQRRSVPSIGTSTIVGNGGSGRGTRVSSPPLPGVNTGGNSLLPPGANTFHGPSSGTSPRRGSYQIFPHPGAAHSPPPHRHKYHVPPQRSATWALAQSLVATTKHDHADGMLDNEIQPIDGLRPAFLPATPMAASATRPSGGGGGDGCGGLRGLHEGTGVWAGETRSGCTGSAAFNGHHVIATTLEEPIHGRRPSSSVPLGFHCGSYPVSPDCDNVVSGIPGVVGGAGATTVGGVKNRGNCLRGEYHAKAVPRQRELHHLGGHGTFELARPHSYPNMATRGSGRVNGYGW